MIEIIWVTKQLKMLRIEIISTASGALGVVPFSDIVLVLVVVSIPGDSFPAI